MWMDKAWSVYWEGSNGLPKATVAMDRPRCPTGKLHHFCFFLTGALPTWRHRREDLSRRRKWRHRYYTIIARTLYSVQVTPLWIKIRLKGMSDIDIEANVTTIFFRVLQRSRAHQMGWIRWSNWEQNESGSYSGEHITRSHQSPRFAHCIAKANTLINALQMFLGKLGTAKYF